MNSNENLLVSLDIDSSVIGEIKYDPITEELFVQFKESKKCYMYLDVSKGEFCFMLHSHTDSMGKHLVEFIIPNKECVELEDKNGTNR